MGHVNERALENLVQSVTFGAQLASQLGIKARQWLIQQKGRRLSDQGTRERHALRFAAGTLARHLIKQVRDAHHFRDLANPLRPFRGRHPLHAQAELDIPLDRFVGKQRMGLEYHPQAAVPWLEVIDHTAVDADLTGAGVLETGNHPQRCGLSAAGWPYKHDKLAVFDGAAEILHRDDPAKGLVQPDKLDACHRYLRTIPKLKPRARCLRMMSPTIMRGMVMPTASAACRP